MLSLGQLYSKAKSEGRICVQCGYIITTEIWNKVKKLPREKQFCGNCYDALKGVNVKTGYNPPRDEPIDMTGEM
jgi:hypothetical protein